MALMEFIKKQFIDVLQWTEDSQGVLAWRYPMADQEIQNGARLVVRESQLALFVDEGRVADVFGPGSYRLSTQTLPLLTNLRHWDKLFESPFKSDVYFFSTRQQIDCKWGTPQPVTVRDPEFGAVRLRAFGHYAYRVVDPVRFQRELSGTREVYTAAELDGQLRGLIAQQVAVAIAESGIPVLDLAASQELFARALAQALAPLMAGYGLQLDTMTVQSISLPDALQQVLDQKIGMGMVGGEMGRLMQYQTAQAIPALAQGGGGDAGSLAGAGIGMGAGVAMGQGLAQQLQSALQPPPAPAAAGVDAEALLATLDKLGQLHAKGVLTDGEFNSKKAELLRKLT